MTDQHHLLDTSSYFDCYHQHHLPYPIPTVSTSSGEASTSSSLLQTPSHFTSSGAPPYELSSPSTQSSHILTPPSVIPTPSPSLTSPTISPFGGFPMAEYSIEQSLYGMNALEHFGSEAIVVAYTYALYHSNDFERLFHLLSTRHFQQIYFNDLQEIWHHARYKESQLKRGKELNPVEKYRLRRKFPPPKTIWDGEETVYSFKDSSRKYLKNFFKDSTQYPTQEQKKAISAATGLKIVQISNWFKNRRQRDKTDQSDRSPPSSSGSSNGHHDFPPVINTQSFNIAFTQHMNMFFEA
uniref:Homeobox domain-containing protein n=1 Tax=Caenorhabditis tropicalis TaxID=1561998 RepID=A0A1I7UVY9_9PELO